MLTVLLHSGIGDIVAVVTRYFGGVKLGKGGLVRAYSGGVKSALGTLHRVEKMPMAEVEAVIGYREVTLFQRMLPEFSAEIVDSSFAVSVSYRLQMPTKHVETFKVRLADLTNGQAQVVVHLPD